MKLEYAIEIARPLPEVFAFVTDQAEMSRWISTLEESKPAGTVRSGTGATFRQIHVEAGKQVEFDGEIVSWTENHCAVMRLANKDATIEVTYRFEEREGGTWFHQSSMVELNNVMLRMAASAFRGTVERRLKEDFERLKSILETA